MKSDVENRKKAHVAFANKAANRTLIVANGSSRDIAHDHPEVIIAATGKLVDRLRSARQK
jgi:hypothetical protein